MDETVKAKTPGPDSRQTLYAYASQYTREAIDIIVEIMRTSRNESLKLGAANTILDKNLPDIKAIEVSGENGEPIKLNIISGADYLSALGITAAASATGSTGGSSEVQSVDLAPESPQDDNSNQSDSEVEST